MNEADVVEVGKAPEASQKIGADEEEADGARQSQQRRDALATHVSLIVCEHEQRWRRPLAEDAEAADLTSDE